MHLKLFILPIVCSNFAGQGHSELSFHPTFFQPRQNIDKVKFQPKNPEKSYATSEKFISRLETYDKYCENNSSKTTLSSLNSLKANTLHQLFYDDNYKLVICTSPKAGTTNWQRVLNTLKSNLTLSTDHWQRRNVYNYADRISEIHPDSNEETIYELYKRLVDPMYHNVITVRHPLTRLLSAWRDKFQKNPATAYFEKKYAKFINERYHDQNDESDNDHYVTFPAFLRYIASEPERYFDFHWKSFHRFCKPCQIRYDYIIKAESSLDDSEELFKDMKISGKVHLPDKYSSSLVPSEHFAAISNELLKRIYSKYEMDFLLFDYKIDDFLK